VVLVLSLIVIVAVAAVVGRVCSGSRPGTRRSAGGSSWGGDVGDAVGGVDVSDGSVHHHGTVHHGGFATHTHDAGGWGGDSGGWGGDAGGGGGDSGGGGD